MNASRTSADAGLAMALGCALLYHAGPWFWTSRTLTIIGVALPICVLAMALRRKRTSPDATITLALNAVGTLALLVMTLNLILSGGVPYRFYALSNVLAQAALCAVWASWLTVAWRSIPAWLGLAGAVTGAIGFAANAHLGFVGATIRLRPDYVPPDPWCSSRSGDCGPVDMLSRVAPGLVLPEVALVGVFVLAWLWWGLRPRLQPRLQG